MSRNRLHECAQSSSGDSENKGPAVLRVQVRVREDKQRLIRFGLVAIPHNCIEDVSGKELLAASVCSGPCFDSSRLLHGVEVELSGRVFVQLAVHAGKEDFNLLGEQLAQGSVKRMLVEIRVRPQLQHHHFLHPRVALLVRKLRPRILREALRHLVSVLV